MKNTTDLKALQPLQDFINEAYCGDCLPLERKISEAIYLLHYLPWETFAGKRVQDTVFVLERLRESFIEAQQYQQTE